MLPRSVVAVLFAVLVGITLGFNHPANAQPVSTSGSDCWIDAATGKPVPKINWPGAPYPPENGDYTHAYNLHTGQNFVKLTDGTWIDAKTGDPVPTINWPGAPYPPENGDYTRAHNLHTGQNFVRVPCPPPAATPTSTQTAFQSHAGLEISEHYSQQFVPTGLDLQAGYIGNVRIHNAPDVPPPSQWSVGVSAGTLFRTSTYDDGFKVNGTTGVLNFNLTPPPVNLAAIDGALTNPFEDHFVPPRIEFPVDLIIPVSSADVRDYAKTQLNAAVTIQIKAQLQVGAVSGFPIILDAGGGPAIMFESAGSNYPGYSYSDSRTILGWTASAGVEVPVTPMLSVELKGTYLANPLTTFSSPYSDYKLKESDWGIAAGATWHFRL